MNVGGFMGGSIGGIIPPAHPIWSNYPQMIPPPTQIPEDKFERGIKNAMQFDALKYVCRSALIAITIVTVGCNINTVVERSTNLSLAKVGMCKINEGQGYLTWVACDKVKDLTMTAANATVVQQ
jgi:predicted transcriptional regulator